MELVAVLSASKGLVTFVEGGGLEAALAEISLSAAETAIGKAGRALDHRGQLWSAVNHLEQAYEANRRVSSRVAVRYLSVLKHGRLLRESTYIQELMSLSYQYLGERTLRDQALDTAQECWDGYWEHRRLIGSAPGSARPVDQLRAAAIGMVNLPATVWEIPSIVRANGEIAVSPPSELRAAFAALDASG